MATKLEFLVAKEKMLVALATVSVAISRPDYVHVAQSLSQSVKAVLVFLIYNRITVKLRKPITIITVKFRIRKQTSKPQ